MIGQVNPAALFELLAERDDLGTHQFLILGAQRDPAGKIIGNRIGIQPDRLGRSGERGLGVDRFQMRCSQRTSDKLVSRVSV